MKFITINIFKILFSLKLIHNLQCSFIIFLAQIDFSKMLTRENIIYCLFCSKFKMYINTNSINNFVNSISLTYLF